MQQKHALFINDINTRNHEIKMLNNVDDITRLKIFKAIPFESEKDLIRRIDPITRRSIKDSPVLLIFQTREQRQKQKIYKALMNVGWIQKQGNGAIESNILKEIAGYAVGIVAKCDNHGCDESILLVDDDDLYCYNDHKWSVFDDQFCMYYEYDQKKRYYHRKNELLGNKTYCNVCCQHLDRIEPENERIDMIKKWHKQRQYQQFREMTIQRQKQETRNHRLRLQEAMEQEREKNSPFKFHYNHRNSRDAKWRNHR